MFLHGLTTSVFALLRGAHQQCVKLRFNNVPSVPLTALPQLRTPDPLSRQLPRALGRRVDAWTSPERTCCTSVSRTEVVTDYHGDFGIHA